MFTSPTVSKTTHTNQRAEILLQPTIKFYRVMQKYLIVFSLPYKNYVSAPPTSVSVFLLEEQAQHEVSLFYRHNQRQLIVFILRLLSCPIILTLRSNLHMESEATILTNSPVFYRSV